MVFFLHACSVQLLGAILRYVEAQGQSKKKASREDVMKMSKGLAMHHGDIAGDFFVRHGTTSSRFGRRGGCGSSFARCLKPCSRVRS